MTLRLRHLLAALSATAAVLTTTVVAATPASAADPTGSTCMDPTFQGSIERGTRTSSMGIPIVVVKFNAVGYTSAICPTTFTQYRYRAAFTYDGRTTSAYQSSLEPVYSYSSSGWVRTGTRIVFPEQTLTYDGYGNVHLAVTSGSKSVFDSTWCRSNEETWDYDFIWLGGTRYFDTEQADGVPRSKVSACP
jgi:hypothetical protein